MWIQRILWKYLIWIQIRPVNLRLCIYVVVSHTPKSKCHRISKAYDSVNRELIYTHCPYCFSAGVVAKFSEHHVLLECKSVRYERTHYNVPECPINSPGSKFSLKRFIGGDHAGVTKCKNVLKKFTSFTVTFKELLLHISYLMGGYTFANWLIV